MRVSLNWLKEYLDLSTISEEELYKIFSLHISEVETVSPLFKGNNLQVGEVLEKVAHPDSDHLNICQVRLKDGVSQIVCGAPNVAVGQKVIVALPGAKLPEITIKPAKVRGVESNGMICSLEELGLENKLIDEKYKEGIYVLPADTKVGEDIFKLGFLDTIYDLELTSNRSDLLSIEGVAYDLGAYLGQQVKVKQPLVKEVRMVNPISIAIESDACAEFNARFIKNVEVKESPLWLKLKLMASGIRPINNIVDITNLVLMEMGQPLHAYDFDYTGEKIIVRNAQAGEVFTTLDEVERKLEPTDIVVANPKEALCLGGVMGGMNSEVTTKTTNILLEAACFDALAVRKTSSRLGLKSESSTRFERKIDQVRTKRALDYAAMLINELAGGVVVGGINGCVRKPYEENKVMISLAKINQILGTNLRDAEILQLFTNLGYKYEANADKYLVTLPSRRMDLEPSIQDITEDIARMIGYENIPTTVANVSSTGFLTPVQAKRRMIRQTLATLGLNEAVTYSLLAEKDLDLFVLDLERPIKVLMPLTSDREVMRQSLLNGLIGSLKYNKARQASDIALFEIGKRYSLDSEVNLISGVLTGKFTNSLWQQKTLQVDFYLVKGLLDEMARRLGLEFSYEAYRDIKYPYHPGRSAKVSVNGTYLGVIAALHPKYTAENDLEDTYVFELDLDKLTTIDNKFKYEPIPKFPAIERDLAIVVKDEITAQQVIDVIKMVSKKYLRSINIFDIYKGVGIDNDEKSMAIKMTFLDKEKTLESQDIDKLINSILNRLDYHFKARLR